jgi:hypothetical protein
MKKVKLFEINVRIVPTAFGKVSIVTEHADLENQVNEFLAKDGKEIEVLDIKYQQSSTSAVVVETVLVYYKEL